MAGPREQLTVLHLSDLQFGAGTVFGAHGLTSADRDLDSLFARLHEDLEQRAEQDGLRPDLVVVTGDLAEEAMPDEYDRVTDFLEQLTAALGLPRHRVAIVPGNHDVSRSACARHFMEEAEHRREAKPPWWPKWQHYVRAFDRFYAPEHLAAGVPAPAFAPGRPWTLYEMPDIAVAVAGLNSTMAASHRDEDGYGHVGEEQLAWFAERLRRRRRDGWLVLGAVHHNAVRGATLDDENLRDAEDLDRVLGHDAPGYPDGGPGPLHLLLHGRTHDGRLHRLPSGLLALSTGSAAVAAADRPAEVPNQYQFVTLRADGVTRWTRQYLRDRRRWAGDNRADLRNDTWHRREAVPVPAPAALVGPEEVLEGIRPEAPDTTPGFVRDVVAATGLRDEGVAVEPVPCPGLPLGYLRVTRTTDDGARHWPVGMVDGVADAELYGVFVEEVHRSFGVSGVRSWLVAATPPGDELRARALRAGVRLVSLAEYRRVLDLDRLRRTQAQRVEADQRYPVALYVPQRYRQEYPLRERGADGLPLVEEDVLSRVSGWLAEDGPRFVTVLGDFGHGKTFLMRQLVRELPERIGGVEPLLVELRNLEKGPSLHNLVDQHLRGLDVGNVTAARVQDLIESGGVALLLDGFDELVARVTYGTAATYLQTLLNAAAGDAKIVLTSRTQHFRDGTQVRGALTSSDRGREASRILAVQDFSTGQIRDFLLRHYQHDEARAEARFRRVDAIKDLLGLSANPRMLSFIANLSEDRLDEAERDSGGVIGAAGLYREILDQWLDGEVKRQKQAHGPQVLEATPRLDACRALAVRLWTSGTVVAEEDDVVAAAAALHGLEKLRFTPAEAGHTIGSGSLLTRTEEGFGFVHRSVMEWLVADTMADALRSSGNAAELAAREMSDLLTDFLLGLGGADLVSDWAVTRLRAESGATTRQRANAARILARLRTAPSTDPAPEPTGPLDLSGQDMRDQDLRALAGVPPHRGLGTALRGADLRNTIWTGTSLDRLDLIGADLSGATLDGASLVDVDLRGARLSGTSLVGARLDQVRLRGATLEDCDFRRARLNDVDLLEAKVTRCRFERAAVRGGWGHQHANLAAATVAGRDEVRVMLPASGPVTAMAALPEAGLLAVARGAVIEVLDDGTAQPVVSLTGSAAVTALAVHGSRLVSAHADKILRIWDVVGGGSTAQRTTHHVVTALCVVDVRGHPVIVAGGRDGRVMLHPVDLSSQRIGVELLGGEVSAVAVLSEGQNPRLAIGTGAGSVWVWRPDSTVGQPLKLHQHRAPVTALAVAHGGDRTVVVSGDEAGVVRAAAPDLPELLAEHQVYEDRVRALAVVEDDGAEHVVIGGGDAVKAWRTTFTDVPGIAVLGPVAALTSLRDERWAACTIPGVVAVWQSLTGGLSGARYEARPVVGLVAGNGDGVSIVAGNGIAATTWGARSGSVTGGRSWRAGPVSRSVLTPRGVVNVLQQGEKLVAQLLTGDDGDVEVSLGTIRPDVAVTAVSASWDEEPRVALGLSNGTVTLGGVVRDRHKGAVTFLCQGTAGRQHLVASAADDDTVRIWDADTGQPVGGVLDHLTVGGLTFVDVAGRPMLAVGCEDGIVRLWDAVTGEPVRSRGPRQRKPVTAIAALPRDLLATGSGHGEVRLWDALTGHLVCAPLTGHHGPVRAVAAVEDGDRTIVATGGDDGTTRLWTLDLHRDGSPATILTPGDRTAAGPLARTLEGEATFVATLLASSSGDGWACLLADGRYRAHGDVRDVLWWASAKGVRFEAGELDTLDDTVRPLPEGTLLW